MNEQARAVDLLSLIGDDKSVVSYRPRWNQLTGSITATILLQQLIYRWVQSGRRPFYKFTGPCTHPLCRPGDTWEEELGLTRRQFETARAAIATRTQGDVADNSLVSYWMTTGHCTWYAINEPLLVERLAALYPAEQPAAVGVQPRLPPPEPFDKSANGAGGNVERRFTNPPSALADLSNGVGGIVERPTEPFDKNANAIGGKRQQINKDDLIDHEEQRPTETTTPAAASSTAADPPPPAAAADHIVHILDWLGFDDALKPNERARLTVSDLLAWAYWVQIKQAERGRRLDNPVAWMRSQWRQQRPVRADLLRLARGWLALDDDGRARLLGRLEWASNYANADPGDDFERDFPDIPPVAAAAVYAATHGQLAPPALSPAPIEPVCPTDRPTPAAQSTDDTPRSVPQTTPSTPATLWREALAELEMQMTRATFATWLHGTTATLTGDTLTVHVRNHHAVDWLENRLHDLIGRTVESVAGRPLLIRYEVVDAQPEAHHG